MPLLLVFIYEGQEYYPCSFKYPSVFTPELWLLIQTNSRRTVFGLMILLMKFGKIKSYDAPSALGLLFLQCPNVLVFNFDVPQEFV